MREWATNESMLSELVPVMTTTLSLIPGMKFSLSAQNSRYRQSGSDRQSNARAARTSDR